jgi:hypothetical protein
MSDKEKYELIKFLKEMIAKFPNDQDLGKEIRKYYYSKKQIKS